MKRMSHWQISAVLAALALVASACSGGTGEETADEGAGGAAAVGGVTVSDDSLIPCLKMVGPSNAYQAQEFEANRLTLANFESLGFCTEYETTPDWTTFSAAVEEDDWAIASAGYLGNLFRIDPDELLSRPLLCDLGGKGGSNYGDYCLEEYDEAVLASKRALDTDERNEHVFRAQEIQALDLPYVTLYHPSLAFVYNKEAYTDVVTATAVGLYNFWNFVDARPVGDDKIYRLGQQGAIGSVNPMGAGDYNTDVEVHHLIYDSLTKISPDGEAVPWAAESWDIEDDTHIVMHLRDDMSFTDGEPVTAEDVKFSFDYTKEWEVGLYVNPLQPIESVDVVDEHTVRFTLTEPTATVFTGAFSQINILPKHIWENVVEEEGLNHPSEWTEQDMVGSGPYTVESVSANEAVELARNPDHFHAPQSEGMVFIPFADNQGVFRALQDGTIYFHQERLTTAAFETAQDEPHLELSEDLGTTVRWTAFSMRDDSPFRDWHLRHALAHAYDYETITEVINGGHATPGTGTIGSGNRFWNNDGIPHEELSVDEPHWHQFDLDKARQLLEEAGYRWDDEGRIHYPEDYEPQLHHPAFTD